MRMLSGGKLPERSRSGVHCAGDTSGHMSLETNQRRRSPLVPKPIIDSYTQEILGEEYVSKIPGIMNGKQDFYRPGAVAVYELSPAAGEWVVLRDGCGASSGMPLFLSHPTRDIAQRVMEWLIRNDDSVRIAMFWMERKNLDPYFRLLNYIQEVALGNYPDPRQRRLFSDSSTGDEAGSEDSDGSSGTDTLLYSSGRSVTGRESDA
jgi:hypothetical protein